MLIQADQDMRQTCQAAVANPCLNIARDRVAEPSRRITQTAVVTRWPMGSVVWPRHKASVLVSLLSDMEVA
jgi:hypothetical protein